MVKYAPQSFFKAVAHFIVLVASIPFFPCEMTIGLTSYNPKGGASGKDTPISDMRPITVTSSLGRLVERSVWDTLFPEIYNDVICFEQFATRKKHSHEMAAIILADIIRTRKGNPLFIRCCAEGPR
jgi:hypothetical protein